MNELHPCQKHMLKNSEGRIFGPNPIGFYVECQLRSRCSVLDQAMGSMLRLDSERGIQEAYVNEQLEKGLLDVCDRECPYKNK